MVLEEPPPPTSTSALSRPGEERESTGVLGELVGGVSVSFVARATPVVLSISPREASSELTLGREGLLRG